MTVSRHRRRVATTRALIATIVGVVLAVVLGGIGAVAIYNTKDGQTQGSGPAELTFPNTPTALIAVVDDSGDLGSVAAVAVRPAADAGRGGTIMPISVSTDSSGGFGSERAPLNETVALFGIDSLPDEVSLALGLSLDDAVVLDRAQLASLLTPLGAVSVTLPAAVTDADGTQVAAAGPQSMSPDTMAAVLAAGDPAVPGATREQAATAVWTGIADAIGAGLSSPLALPAAAGTLPTPATGATSVTTGSTAAGELGIGAVLGALTSGPVVVRSFKSTPIMSVDLNPRGVDAVVLDRADVATVLGHVAPGRLSAPNPGSNFQVLSNYGDDQLPPGVTRFAVAYTATKTLLADGDNVLSADSSPGHADAATVVEVADEQLVDAASSLSDIFGPVDVRVAEHPVAGIDVIVLLGTDYLSTLNTAAATSTIGAAGSAAAASAATVGPDGTA